MTARILPFRRRPSPRPGASSATGDRHLHLSRPLQPRPTAPPGGGDPAMGATNVALVFTRWAHLPDKAFRALGYMALVALDQDTEPRYWGGWEGLAEAIGRTPPAEPADSDTSPRAEEYRRMRRNDFEAVKTAMRQVFKAGAAAVEKPSGPGRPATYRLLLGAPTGKERPVEQGRIDALTGKVPPVEQGRFRLPRGEHLPTGGAHQRIMGGVSGTGEEQNSPKVTTSPAGNASCPQILDFDAARILLESFPDFGESWLNRPEVKRFTGTTNRYIAAAELALKEMRRLPGTGTGAS